ncbi:nuclear transport factor 2 family protein [Mucilaginibacter sp. ZT4R22]|uniref:Nuclear transport factor 2 family protein n=1 Tax=Mucilaginibacter pankratovii TaxID=2772110 RepID=A0ABR7WYW3_9SPHI|nr:nuclear transport factor 2 family protein [Mucilaginibacter pankratovii]MBD1366634.1 nuclear transport factor 2 family protein [Mucilaginibacter pankratovii]
MRSTISYTLYVLFAAMAFAACTQQPDKPAVDKKSQSETLIQEHFRYLNDHDLKSLVGQYAPKASITSSDWKGMVSGREGADQIFHLEFYVSPDAKYLVDKVINTDSTVVVEYDVIGLKDKANGGVRYDVRKCSIFRIDDKNNIGSEATYVNAMAYHNGN